MPPPAGASALYENTGMPAASAFATGWSKACGSTMQVAMALALEAMAAFMALTISPTSALAEPDHW